MILFTRSRDPTMMDGIYLTGKQAKVAYITFQIVLLSFTYLNLVYLLKDQLISIPSYVHTKLKSWSCYNTLTIKLGERYLNLTKKLTV